MATSIIEFVVKLKRKVFDNEVGRMKADTAKQMNSMIVGMRRTAQIGMSMSQAMGGSMDASLMMGIEAGLLTLEMATAAMAAATASTLGLNIATGKILLQAGTIAALLVSIRAAESGRADIQRSMNGVVSMGRLLTF